MMSEDITVSPFYYSAINEITKPGSLVFISHYFVDRWMRDLGPVGTAIVTVLRSHCYQNRATQEIRNRIQLSVPAIAAEVGVSSKTIRREMEANKVLQKFLQRREEYAPGPTPQSLRTDAYSYLVAMDDPVHPLDQELLQEAIREKARRMEKGGGEEDAKTRARRQQSGQEQSEQKQGEMGSQKPRGQIDHAEPSRVVNLSIPPGQIVPPLVKLSIPPGQIDHTLIDSSDSLEFKENPSSDFLLSLFPEPERTGKEKIGKEKIGENLALPPPPRWQDLTEEAQRPYVDQARHELVAIHAGSGITPKPKLVEVRARNLHELAVR